MPPLRWSALASSSAKKGLPPRGLPEPDQRRPRERRVEAGAEQLADRADGSGRRPRPFAVAPRARRGEARPAGRRGPRAALRPARWSRRASAYRSAASDAASSHWTSSTARQRGLSRASSRNAPRNAAATARSSSVDLRLAEQQAPSSARRWIGGSSGKTSPAALPRRSVSPANENWVSASEGRAERIR